MCSCINYNGRQVATVVSNLIQCPIEKCHMSQSYLFIVTHTSHPTITLTNSSSPSDICAKASLFHFYWRGAFWDHASWDAWRHLVYNALVHLFELALTWLHLQIPQRVLWPTEAATAKMMLAVMIKCHNFSISDCDTFNKEQEMQTLTFKHTAPK